ncbi:MAG: SDR family NAD(P)-dependent oxidoreductase, partial [Trueperaceae bacterium]
MTDPRNHANDPSGKVAIVTGASSGIGAATARALAAVGARLVIAARREERLDALAAELEAGGSEVRTVAADLRTQAGAEAVIAAAVGAFGRIDVLVNNAGVMF